MKLKKIFTAVVFFILFFYGFFFILLGSLDTRLQNLPYPALVGLKIYSENDPIWDKFHGNGSRDNPKIIENFVLLERERRSVGVSPSVIYEPIEIKNIFFHFTIRNCWIIVHGVCGSGFYLENSPNCRVENCMFQWGLVRIQRASIVNNTFYLTSPYTEFEGCPEISGNIFVLKPYERTSGVGGVRFFSKNNIYGNNFFVGNKWNETGGCVSAAPGYMNGSGIGNYWSCWTQPDTNNDGIVDIPFRPFSPFNTSISDVGVDCCPSVNPFPLAQKEVVDVNLDENGVIYTTRLGLLWCGVALISIGAIAGGKLTWASLKKK